MYESLTFYLKKLYNTPLCFHHLTRMGRSIPCEVHVHPPVDFPAHPCPGEVASDVLAAASNEPGKFFFELESLNVPIAFI